MRSNRRRNWLVKRIALGLAIAAVAAPVAQAKMDEGSSVQANGYQAFVTDFPPSSAVSTSSNQIELVRVEQPRSTPSAAALAGGNQIELVRVEQPRSTPSDNAFARGDQIEVVRAVPRAAPSDKIEFVRTQPRSIDGPQVVAAGFDWNDAAVGAGLVVGLMLLGWGAVLATRHLGRTQTA
jgi:hypothetical protein